MPDFPRAHIILAWSQTLSDRNPDVKRFPDGSIDWGMDVHSPRVGWYLQNAKEGTLWSTILPDSTRQMADPFENKTTVPTFIIHGDTDMIIPISISRQMIEKLKSWGVECGFVEAEGQSNGFDVLVEEIEPEWKYILPGLQFIARHVASTK
jgi:pimeloyl-ACP methyl ester carboxylesterase